SADVKPINVLSISNCVASRIRDAPSDKRTASSRRRSTSRANIKFATLAHATTSTSNETHATRVATSESVDASMGPSASIIEPSEIVGGGLFESFAAANHSL